MASTVASVLAKLKNKSIIEGIQLHQVINLFCQEEFIRRLSHSKYKKNLILKGGFLLYSLSGFTARPTVDTDYLLKNYPSSLDTIEKLVSEVISLPSKNNYINLKIRGFEVIGETREYHGVRANIIGLIGHTKTPFSIDFGIGDIVIPSAVIRRLPVILPEFEQPEILTYSLESIVAEKLDAIISLMEVTGRMKDFFDIHYLATTFDFDGRKLQEAIFVTLSNRGTPYEQDTVKDILRLAEDVEIQNRWKNFCKKVLKYELDFRQVVEVLIDFVLPPYKSMIYENEFFKTWRHKDRKYI
ncbi:MAG: nucleotidyltransferase [Alkaliphilus sp.]|nr:nucleotidyl transferase AbiEii/AbiGii toxin family protein [Alkaliphilus sp. AH-315-G20]MBN4074844.1 nucleotidyl transferase AbiEii/AbiGii toxin family protein [bacterium AH-315-E09]PHS30937.1 MAG: nucleotidyltransferase [Alkaliphilus sp.]